MLMISWKRHKSMFHCHQNHFVVRTSSRPIGWKTLPWFLVTKFHTDTKNEAVMWFVFLASGWEVKAVMYYILCDRSIQALYSENQYSVYCISIDSSVGVIDCYIALLMVISQDGHVHHARRFQNEERELRRLPTSFTTCVWSKKRN